MYEQLKHAVAIMNEPRLEDAFENLLNMGSLEKALGRIRAFQALARAEHDDSLANDLGDTEAFKGSGYLEHLGLNHYMKSYFDAITLVQDDYPHDQEEPYKNIPIAQFMISNGDGATIRIYAQNSHGERLRDHIAYLRSKNPQAITSASVQHLIHTLSGDGMHVEIERRNKNCFLLKIWLSGVLVGNFLV